MSTKKQLEERIFNLQGEIDGLQAEVNELLTENLSQLALLSGIAAGNDSRKDAADYIQSTMDRLTETANPNKTGV